MAMREALGDLRPPHDSLAGIPLPAQTIDLFGHEAIEVALIKAYRSGRMPHALLLSGPAGIGKAVLAFHFIRFIIDHPDPSDPALAGMTRLAPPSYPADDHDGGQETPSPRSGPGGEGLHDKLAKGIHPNVRHLTRAYDERAKRYRTEISVETIRGIIPFLGTSAAEGAWRFIVVDPVDDLNRNAANALLKSLEEPPARTLFLLISHSAGQVLPTIRSRASLVRLSPLSGRAMQAVLKAALSDEDMAGLTPDKMDDLLTIAEGSPRRAIEFLREGGLELHGQLVAALATGDPLIFHKIAERCADPRSGTLTQFHALYCGYLQRRIKGQTEPGHPEAKDWSVPLVTWSDLWDKAGQSLRDVEIYNLDRRQHILNLLETSTAALHRDGR